MADAQKTLIVPKNKTTFKTFRVRHGVTKELLDLSGQTATFTVRLRPEDTDPIPGLIVKTVGSGIVILDQVTNKGELQVQIDPADTVSLAAMRYYYDLVVSIAGFDKGVVLPNDFKVVEMVTHT